jgi:hypothetical protein
MVAALAELYVMGAPFGFMAFLGVASLIGVIAGSRALRDLRSPSSS